MDNEVVNVHLQTEHHGSKYHISFVWVSNPENSCREGSRALT